MQDKNIELGKSNTGVESNDTAVDGGITLLAGSDGNKEIKWIKENNGTWYSSENLKLNTGKSISIGVDNVLTNNTLGSTVTQSSLQTVGTITSGIWQGEKIDIKDKTTIILGDNLFWDEKEPGKINCLLEADDMVYAKEVITNFNFSNKKTDKLDISKVRLEIVDNRNHLILNKETGELSFDLNLGRGLSWNGTTIENVSLLSGDIKNNDIANMTVYDEKIDVNKTKLNVNSDNKLLLDDNKLTINVLAGEGLSWQNNTLNSFTVNNTIENRHVSVDPTKKIDISKTTLNVGTDLTLNPTNGLLTVVDMRTKPGEITNELVSNNPDDKIQMKKTNFSPDETQITFNGENGSFSIQDIYLKNSGDVLDGNLTINGNNDTKTVSLDVLNKDGDKNVGINIGKDDNNKWNLFQERQQKSLVLNWKGDDEGDVFPMVFNANGNIAINKGER